MDKPTTWSYCFEEAYRLPDEIRKDQKDYPDSEVSTPEKERWTEKTGEKTESSSDMIPWQRTDFIKGSAKREEAVEFM